MTTTTGRKAAALAARILAMLTQEYPAKIWIGAPRGIYEYVCSVADLKLLAEYVQQVEKPKRVLVCGQCRTKFDANKPHGCRAAAKKKGKM